MAAAKVFKCVIMCYYESFMYMSCTGHVQVMYKLFYGNTNFMYYDSPVLTMLSWHISENPFFWTVLSETTLTTLCLVCYYYITASIQTSDCCR